MEGRAEDHDHGQQSGVVPWEARKTIVGEFEEGKDERIQEWKARNGLKEAIADA